MDKNAALKIDEAVRIGLNCLAAGIDSRQEVRRNILSAVARFSPCTADAATLEGLPISVMDLLHERLGLAFVISGGKLAGALLDGGTQ